MSEHPIDVLARKAGVTWFDYQEDALVAAVNETRSFPRRCLYYKTGAGKSVTALAMMSLWNVTEVLVITPPSTYTEWEALGKKLGVKVECMSHAKFRMPGTKLSRTRAVIADEMHMFGGHQGKGWTKLDRLALHLQAPMVLASATPNYNDADRVYCIQHILDPVGTKGGFLQFIYTHCTTMANPFGIYPEVTGFHRYTDAAAYLAALPGVDYLPDDLVYKIKDLYVQRNAPTALITFGINRRKARLIASQMEERHAIVDHNLIGLINRLQHQPAVAIEDVLKLNPGPALIFANHSTVAEACAKSLLLKDEETFGLITGKTSTKNKASILASFKRGEFRVLIGTASLATGTDGLDKICDTMIILDDTDDASLRRQLIGRIMPRGASTNLTAKKVYRIVPQ